MESALRIGRTASARLVEYLLVLTIFVGSLVMWIGVPLGWVWVVGQLADHPLEAYGMALFGCPITMVLFGLLLARLNGLHMRLTGGPSRQARTAWLKSVSGERRPRGPRTVLDISMTVSVVIADRERPVAVLLGPHEPEVAVTQATERVALAAIQAKGVPTLAVEEALWTAIEIMREEG